MKRNGNSTSRTKLSAAGNERRKSTTQLKKEKEEEGWMSSSQNSKSGEEESGNGSGRLEAERERGRGRTENREEGSREREVEKKREERDEEEEEDEDEGLTMDTKRRGRMLKEKETVDPVQSTTTSNSTPNLLETSKVKELRKEERIEAGQLSQSEHNFSQIPTSTSKTPMRTEEPLDNKMTNSISSQKSDGSDGTLAQPEEDEEIQPYQISSNSQEPQNSPTSTLTSSSIITSTFPTPPRPNLDHRSSSASARTLRHNHKPPESPGSTRSRSSIRTRAPLPSGDKYSNSTGVAPPKLDTHNALVGFLGALHEDRASTGNELSSNRYSTSPTSDRRLSAGPGISGSASAPDGWQEIASRSGPYLGGGNGSVSKRKASVGSVGSNINVPISGPSVAGISKASISRYDTEELPTSSNRRNRAESSEPGGSYSTESDSLRIIDQRSRTTSTQSLGAADAARLAAKLRLARDGPSEDRSFSIGGSGSGSSTSAATNALTRAGSAVGLSSLAMNTNNSRDRNYPGTHRDRHNDENHKPAVSTFSRTSGNEERKVPEPAKVIENSVYHSSFSNAESMVSSSERRDLEATIRSSKRDGKRKSQPQERSKGPQVRYLLDYGLSGPPLRQTALVNALLAPSFSTDEFDASWAPALANAAGLGTKSHSNSTSKAAAGSSAAFAARTANEKMGSSGLSSTSGNAEMLASGTALANGPNAVPLHFVHGLTSTNDEPFPLEANELPVGLTFDSNEDLSNLTSTSGDGNVRYIDPRTMRSIAITSHSLAVLRSHTVTRRFRDPMRESLERVFRESGSFNGLSMGNRISGSTFNSPGSFNDLSGSGNLKRGSNPTSPSASTGGFHLSRVSSSSGDLRSNKKPDLMRSNTGLSGATEQPLNTLKRVWSGGLGRGGLGALTKSDGRKG